jgi:DNA-directed RNA polymerase subunit RPC12/RpoP
MRPSVVRQPHEEDRLTAEGSMSDRDRTVVATSTGGTTVLQQDRSVALRCGTCSATFTTGYALQTHLQDAYHGFQCLHCGALFARRGQMNEHDCQDQQGWQDTLHAAVSDWIGRDAEHDPWEGGDL